MSVTLRKASDTVTLVKGSPVWLLPTGCTFNAPCAASGHVTTIAGQPVAKIDYSDGYGHEYAVGE